MNSSIDELQLKTEYRKTGSVFFSEFSGGLSVFYCFKNSYLCEDEEVLADIEELSGESGYLSLVGFDYCIV